jgi:hypothetical protein
MILYVIIGLVLASFVFAFLSAKTWHWGYVILVELIFLTSVGFFILAAESLRINAILRTQVNTLEKQVAEVSADVEGLKFGTDDPAVLARLRASDPPVIKDEDAESIPSIEELNHQLLIATRRRGRVWRYVSPAGVDPRTGAVRVTFAAPPRPAPADPSAPEEGPPPAPAPAPGGIKDNTVVYVFEDGPPRPAAPGAQGAPSGLQFLGEFTVTQAAGQTATLQPTGPLEANAFELRRLAASRGPWVIYETMPLDRHDIYAGLTDEQLKQLLPKDTVDEFLKHGKEAATQDDPERKLGLDADGNPLLPDEIDKAVRRIYQRRLRDYANEFDEAERSRIATQADIDAVKKDIEQLTAAEEVAKRIQSFRTEERQKLTADLAGVTKEREAIEKHLGEVEKLLTKARELTAQLMERNRQLAAQLAARHRASLPPANGSGAAARPAEPLALDRTK